MATLRNTEKRTATFNLDHASCCVEACRCEKSIRTEAVRLPGGGVGHRERERLVCPSLSFQPLETRADVPEWALLAGEVQAALVSGKLRKV
jgi:hypothetical protein